jgi:hypothetical protein
MGLRFKIHQANDMASWRNSLDGRNYWNMTFSFIEGGIYNGIGMPIFFPGSPPYKL